MKIAIIGGPFYWKLWGIEPEKIQIETPYGKPADFLFKGAVGQHEAITLLRHGAQNEFSLSEMPYLANVFAIGTFKPDFVIHVTLCGAFKKTGKVGDLFLFDQLIDWTKSRPYTFGKPLFDKVHHFNFGSPISSELLTFAHQILTKKKIKHHFKGTMLTEEGPRFCTAAEAKMFRILGADALNMTSCPEIYLLRELGLPVLAISLITNIVKKDSCIESEEITANVANFRMVIPSTIKLLIEHLPKNIELTNPKVSMYNIKKFDLHHFGK